MKNKNNNFIIKTIFKFYFSFLIIQFKWILIIYGRECNENEAKPRDKKCINTAENEVLDCHFYYKDNKCYKCDKNTTFYIIKDNKCQAVDYCENKVIFETNECVGHCPNGMKELGDYCYYQCNNSLYMTESDDSIFEECKCIQNYKKNLTIIENGNKKLYECLESCQTPNNYYDVDLNQCLQSCDKKKYLNEIENSNNDNEIKCSSKCDNTNRYLYSNYCLKKCPTFAPYYYTLQNEDRICVDKCKNEDIYKISDNIENGKECVTECGGDFIKIFDILDETENIKVIKCKIKEQTDTKLYKYDDIYFKDCSDTLELFNRTTYSYIQNLTDSQYKCVDDCSSTTDKPYINITNECVKECDKKFYKNKCFETCNISNKDYYSMDYSNLEDTIFEINIPTVDEKDIITIDKIKYPESECLETCPIGTYFDQEYKKCFISCKDKYINSSFGCENSCIYSTYNESVYINISNKYYNITRQFCLDSCPQSLPYYNYEEKDCHKNSCKDRKKYSAYDKPFICYDSCEKIEGNYTYSKNYICYNTPVNCESNYYKINNIIKCASVSECIKKDFHFIREKECTNECGENYYKIESILNNNGELQNIGACFLDPKDCEKEGYIFYNKTNKTCTKECNSYKTSETNPQKNEEGETCFNECPSNYPYNDSEHHLCLSKCDSFYYGKNCINDCKNIDKYFFKGTFECIDECKIGNKYYYQIKNSTDNICYDSCPESHQFIEKVLIDQNETYKCINKCPEISPYYYDDKKICLKSCDVLYNSENKDEYKCVYQCSLGQKVNQSNYCVDSCKDDEYIVKEKLSITNSLVVEKCVSACPPEYPLKSNSTKQCLKYCTFPDIYKFGDDCFEKCPNGTYLDEINKECRKDDCPSEYKYYEINNEGVKICKNTCNKKSTKEGGECSDKCPEKYKYIGYNTICLEYCTDYYGEFNVKIDNENYECVKSCGENLIVNDTKECVTECPDYYYRAPNNQCYRDCKLDKENHFSTIDENGKNICSKSCNKTEPYFGVDKICRKNCSELGSKIKDYDGACVSQCNNSYYNYLENNKCVHQCNDTKFIISDNYICVDKCEYPYNYKEGKECKKKCENENHFIKEIDENIFECVDKCDNDQVYYNGNSLNKKKCLSKCSNDNHFIIENENICIANCPSDYKSYIYSSSIVNATYKKNMCVLKCPFEKPFVYEGICISECPPIKKYHIDGDDKCINFCPDGSLIIDNVCRNNSCPNNKFLDNTGNKCIDKCDDNHPYYFESIKKCLNECGEGYFIEDNKCVSSCSENRTYLYNISNNIFCRPKCPNNTKFLNKNKNECLEKCPEEYPFYEYDNKTDINICVIKCNNVSNPDGECKYKCESKYSFYNYENETCLEKCPYFYVEINTNESICYRKCPNDYPYIKDNNQCDKECNGFINLTNNECQMNCEKMQYNDTATGQKYCLNNCDDLGLFNFSNKECVRDCSKVSGSNYIANMETKECDCENLFYFDNNGNKVCIPPDDNNCPNYKYKYRLYGTYQCVDICTNYLSVDEKYCYTSLNQCPQYPKDLDLIDGKLVCKFNYYINEIKSKICLSENEPCPSTYNYLILDENRKQKECVKNCSEQYFTFKNFCLKKERGCENKKIWFTNETEYTCGNNCPSNYPYFIDDIKQCVKNCHDTDYFILHNGKCLLNCKDIPNTVVKQNSKRFPDGSIEIFYQCACTSDLWYFNNNNIYCNSDSTKQTCSDLSVSKELLIKETKECVHECPEDYPFKFNGECFYSCEDVKKYYDYDVISDNDIKECKCEKLWKSYKNSIICLKGDICNEEGANLLIYDSNECTDKCPAENYIIFNNTCYQQCPENTKPYENENSEKSCICENKWYKYDDKSLNINNTIVCFIDNTTNCPKDFYPYLNKKTLECLDDLSKCEETKVFNYECLEECPENTLPKENSNLCECDKEKGLWSQYISEGQILLECGLKECPLEKSYLDFDTNECIYACGDKYHFKGKCYSKCPENTNLVDKISKECEETFTFDDPEDLKSLEENVNKNIKTIYNKTSSGGLVFNINNSTMQIYGINKNKEQKKDIIMRSNLTYIDLSNCIDKLYEKNGLSEDTDIIIVKYDIGDITNSSAINPVEFKIINSQTGEEIPLDACEDNSIVISYPLSSILNNFDNQQKNLRNLEEKNEITLNLREKFLKGKELYLEDEEIDSFNFENKLYNDMCYRLKINGKDLILEDRVNYLYPLYSFCESNCIYSSTDFIFERVNCNCSPKDGINFERNFEFLKNDADIQKAKDKQKGSVLKCLSKVKEISKNFGFFYGLIIILVFISMALLTFLYSYKVLIMRIKNKLELKEDENVNNIDTENIENLSGNKSHSRNKNEEIIKTSERALESPPKKNKKLNINDDNRQKTSEEPEVINIKKLKVNKKQNSHGNSEEKISSSNSKNKYIDKSSIDAFKDMEDENVFDLVKLEEKLLAIEYEEALRKNRAEIFIMILTEILDKIYLIKAIWFLNKYELFSLYFSLYILWHMLILSFLSLFYNNSNLHKIWLRANYPDLNYHLSFGFLSCILSFLIYKGLSFLINNDRKINELESLKKERNEEYPKKLDKMFFWAKIKIIIFYAVEFILLFLFYLYLIAFCGIYIGTNAKLVESYGIALIEVIIIKILYGLVLGILRKISLVYKMNKLYEIVRFLDLYIS